MATTVTDLPIGGLFDVDPSMPLADVAGGMRAFAASSRRPGTERLMAVQVRNGQSPRVHPIAALSTVTLPGVLTPLACGNGRGTQGRPAMFVICRRPPGPSLADSSLPGTSPPDLPSAAAAARRPWSETELIETVLRPIAATLAHLQSRQVTHRAIRPDNVFQVARGHPVVLGCAWAAPPASDQPAVYEPPYSAACLPAGRGDGEIADDVYALGVLLVALAAGLQPLAGMDPVALVARKLLQGSLAAVTADLRLPGAIADLARGMLAEDPDHRPSPALLANPEAARTRRVAARPTRYAQRPLEVGARAAWGARGLAHALATEPVHAALLLRSGNVDRWLRRSFGDESVAQEVDELVRGSRSGAGLDDSDADALMILRVVALLDPLAPVAWRGLMLWPGSLGPCLAEATAEQEPVLIRLVELDALVTWADVRPDRRDAARLGTDAPQHRRLLHLPGWAGGAARLRYTLNPLLPCRARHVQAAMVTRMADLLAALEIAAAAPDRPKLPLDADLGAFIAARFEGRPGDELATMGRSGLPPGEAALAQLRVLVRVQARHPAEPVPALAGWLADGLAAVVDLWRSRTRQAAARAALAEQAAGGRLAALLAVLDDPSIQTEDLQAAAAAEAALRDLDARIAALTSGGIFRREQARRLGQEIAAGCGAVAAAIAVAVAVT